MKTKNFIMIAITTAGLLATSIGVVSADETATPSSTPKVTKSATPKVTKVSKDAATVAATAAYTAAMVAYRVALTQYRVAVVLNDIKDRAAVEKYWADWQVTLTTYQVKWKADIDKFWADHNAWALKHKPLNVARKAALDMADNDFVAANLAATTPAQQEAALKARSTAYTAASKTYKDALALIGAEPVAPTKPAELAKPALPAKTVDPVKPIIPVKPITKK